MPGNAFKNGAPLFLADVADVIEDAENVRLVAWMNDVPAVIVNIQRQPGANVIEVVDRVTQLTDSLERADQRRRIGRELALASRYIDRRGAGSRTLNALES